MVKKVSSIGSLVDVNKFKPEMGSAEDFLNIPLTINSVERRQGRFGEYVVMECDIPSNEKPVLISTGAQSIVGILDDLESNPEFSYPVAATIRKQGNSYYLA